MKVLLLESAVLKVDGIYKMKEISNEDVINLITEYGFESAIKNEYVQKIAGRFLSIEVKQDTYFSHLEVGQKAIVVMPDRTFMFGGGVMGMANLKSITKFKLIERIE